MKKFKKILAPLALTGIMAFTTACVQQQDDVQVTTGSTTQAEQTLAQNDILLPPPPPPEPDLYNYDFDYGYDHFFPLPNFMHLRGKVVEVIQDYDMYIVVLECPETQDLTRVLVDAQSALIVDGEIAEGMNMIGYYDSTMPVPMIYPPQHRAVILMEEPPYSTLLARFYDDGNALVSYDGIHSLDITPETDIICQDGATFEGELDGRKLLIEFYEEGRVLTPSRIIVLFEIAIHPDYNFDMGISGGPALLSPEDIDALWANMFDPETVQIIVLGEVIDAPTPFTCSIAGTIMLPVVAIAEALGYTVVDEGSEVIIAPGSIVTEGVNSYFRGREAARELTSAPVMQDDVLFVPWEFFFEILSAAAMIVDGDVHVVAHE